GRGVALDLGLESRHRGAGRLAERQHHEGDEHHGQGRAPHGGGHYHSRGGGRARVCHCRWPVARWARLCAAVTRTSRASGAGRRVTPTAGPPPTPPTTPP